MNERANERPAAAALLIPSTTRLRVAALLRGLLIAALPLVTGLYIGAVTFPGGSMLPWNPVMVDLDVYRRAGQALLDGEDIYNIPGRLPFLYPPFAALLAVPLALLPPTVVQIGWTGAGVLAILAVLHRFGLQGWPLSLITAATVVWVQPVSQTLAFGQLGIFLVALVVLDLVPGPRLLGDRRLLPEGTLTGVAAAIKLTPALFVLYLLAALRRRPALVAILTGAVVTIAAAVAVPGLSLTFWGGLARGETGLGHSLIYFTNQSVMADAVRILGLGSGSVGLGLLGAALVAALGVVSGARWYRQGEVALAVVSCGVASLLASPVSWLHHFVWVVPMALCLVDSQRACTAPGHRLLALPVWFRVLGWLFVGWVVAAPFGRLPGGADVELTWTWQQNLQASVTALLGVAWLVAGLVVARGGRPNRPGSSGDAYLKTG